MSDKNQYQRELDVIESVKDKGAVGKFFGYSKTGNYTSDADALARHRQGQGQSESPSDKVSSSRRVGAPTGL